ncbi:hypothetical protein [Mycolicibacterium sphagni]|uniref:hypothetical protein n=1 Tax=Mycolicibacterium sphagni TaxID=1786 RepID=UPI0021F3257B|nr:hypothetical protein [Mycolicibacterium sphagni]MCV7174828.1 hypothetical protein [Mycolicibacterium sphagni]
MACDDRTRLASLVALQEARIRVVEQRKVEWAKIIADKQHEIDVMRARLDAEDKAEAAGYGPVRLSAVI